jgi:hypothetical protein
MADATPRDPSQHGGVEPIGSAGVKAPAPRYTCHMSPEAEAKGEPDNVFFNRPGVATVLWDPAIQAVSTEWHGWADRAEFVAVLEAGLLALKKHHASRGLVDSRRQRDLPWPDQDWVSRQWFPRALAAGLTRLALVVPESELVMMRIEEVVSSVRGTSLDVAYFATCAEANEWLALTPAGSPTPVSST